MRRESDIKNSFNTREEEINEAIDQKDMSIEEAMRINKKLADLLNNDPDMCKRLNKIANEITKK